MNGRHYRSGDGGNILRKDSAPPLSGADYVCDLIHDAQAEGFRIAAMAHYKRKLDDSTRLADAARELVGKTAKSGPDPSENLTRMEEMGVKAATLDASNRALFQESSRLLQDPAVSVVDAALGACGVLAAPPQPNGAPAAAAVGAFVGASSVQGVAAAVRAAGAAPSTDVAAATEDGGRAAPPLTPRSRGDWSSRGSSIVNAQTLFGANNLSTAQAGVDTACRLSLTGSVSSRAGSESESASARAGSGTRSNQDPASPCIWPAGERQRFDESLGAFEMPSLSAMTSEELGAAAHRGSLGEGMASKLPEVEADFIDGARSPMLLGVMLTCGVVTPARFAEQFWLSRLQKPHSNLLMMLAVWMVKIHNDAVASSAEEARGRKPTRSGDVLVASGNGTGSGNESPDGDGPFDVDEIPAHASGGGTTG